MTSYAHGLRRTTLVVAVLAMSCGSFRETLANNWTRFRGPNGSGVAEDTKSPAASASAASTPDTKFPATWTDEDYLWKIDLPGVGHSSPVGWEDKIFVTSGDPETGTVTLLALSASSGNEIWRRDFAGQTYSMHAGNSYASTTPALDEQHVYLTWTTGGKMHCMALTHEGAEIWQADLGDFTGPHGFAASPMVADGVVCTQVDQADGGFLAGLDATSGEVRWRAQRPAGKATYATPCEIALANGKSAVISQSMTGGMQAIELQTGKVAWENADAFPARCVSSPFTANKMVIGVCGGGGAGTSLVGMDLTSSAQHPAVKLLLSKQLPYVPTPLVVNQRLFLWHDQGKVSMADLSTGTPPKKVVWTERIGGKFFGSPILAGDKIYCLSMEGHAVVIGAGDEFELLGDNDLGQPSNATPAVHQGRLYLRTESTLACLPAE